MEDCRRERDAKAIKRRLGRSRESNARIRRIVPHNFRLASRPPGIAITKPLHSPWNFDCLSRERRGAGVASCRALRGVGRILLKENSVPRGSLKTHLPQAAPLRAGNLKVHSKLFASVYNAIPFVQLHKRNEIICDAEVVILTSRRTLRRVESSQECLGRIKSFSRAIIARIQNLPATLTRRANDST